MILENCSRFARILIPALTMTITLAAASVLAQSPTFVRTDHPSLGNNHVVADFNGDGKPDLAGLGAKAAAVLLGNGDGTFQARVEYPVADWTQDLAAGDFNRDGHVDLVVTINNPDISLSLLPGHGDGTFDAAVNFPNTSHLDSPAVVATDLDNDGMLDVVIGHEIACWTAPCVVGRTISVMRGNGDGTFQPAREIDIGTTTAKIAVGDFNRDGINDLGIASDSSHVVILLGVGNGTFIQQPTMTLTEDTFFVNASDIDVADVNGDTIEDLVVAIASNGSRTAVLTGNGDGTFRQPPLIITEPNLNVPQYQAVADFNGDGFQDLALCLANGNNGLMEILNGNGDGTFQPPVMYLVPPDKSSIGCVALIAAELNGDGKPDLALAIGGASSGLAVLRNSTGNVPVPVPSAPSLVFPGNGATVTQPVTLDWSEVANAVGYEVQVDNSSTIAAPFVANPTVTESHVTLAGLPAQRLWWRVRARNSAGVSGPFSATRRFTPQATQAAATLSAVSVNPSTVVGGNGSTGTATLTAAAPTGGAVVAISSSNTAVASVPASVTIGAGATSASFAIATAAVSTSTPVTLTGSHNGTNRTATLTVTPQGQAATLTVTATGRTGERVTSTPSGINVSVGSTGSASFATGTSVTLAATNGRDVIWSGTCSSGGNKTKICTFTLNGNAAVTANVQ